MLATRQSEAGAPLSHPGSLPFQWRSRSRSAWECHRLLRFPSNGGQRHADGHNPTDPVPPRQLAERLGSDQHMPSPSSEVSPRGLELKSSRFASCNLQGNFLTTRSAVTATGMNAVGWNCGRGPAARAKSAASKRRLSWKLLTLVFASTISRPGQDSRISGRGPLAFCTRSIERKRSMERPKESRRMKKHA